MNTVGLLIIIAVVTEIIMIRDILIDGKEEFILQNNLLCIINWLCLLLPFMDIYAYVL